MEQVRLPRRQRVAILAALLGLTIVSWAYLVHMALGMDMDSTRPAEMLTIHPWMLSDFVLMFLMWAVMMVGMMVPTAIPMTLVYGAVAAKAARQGTPVASAMIFVTGYVAVWTIFSLGATVAQWGLDQAALLSPMMVSTSPYLGAALLIVAGIYQMTPAKNVCLRHCQSPAHFISQQWRDGGAGAFGMGFHHGWYCLGCCWALMGLLFFGGVMNLFWIAGITLFVLLEKVLPLGRRAGLVSGLAMIVFGVFVLTRL